MESDEALARRLQAQEMGLRQNGTPDAQTPLMNDGRRNNPTVINSRLNELASARMSVYVICGINIPQVISKPHTTICARVLQHISGHCRSHIALGLLEFASRMWRFNRQCKNLS